MQDLRDRTYYLSNGVIRVGGRRVATNAANFTKGDIVGVVLDADQGEIVFLRNGIEQGRARGIRGRLYPFVSFDSEGDQITLLGKCSYCMQHGLLPVKQEVKLPDGLQHVIRSQQIKCKYQSMVMGSTFVLCPNCILVLQAPTPCLSIGHHEPLPTWNGIL